jgi:L-fuculose-phosphate aldolase
MHLCVYDRRPDIAACVHAHPPYAIACSVAGISLAEPVLPETVIAVGEIAMADYAAPSTMEVADSVAPLVEDHDAIILKNHGVLTIGIDVETAVRKMELVEHLAQVVFLASQLGRVDRLTAAQVQALRAVVTGIGQTPNGDARD